LSISEGKTATPLNADTRQALAAIVGGEALLTDPGDCWPYGYDNSRRHALPQAVVFATSHEQVRDIVVLCNRQRIPLIARGKGTGTTGATVPHRGGIILALERMDRILEIDPANRIARVQPGVTNQALQQALYPHGFFWPPDPTSAAICTVGGNLAYNSAGPRAVKYGTPRENTLGLRAVSGAGEELRTGVITSKGVVGYDLTRLLIGSEGTLAIITEAVLKLTPLPEAKATLQATYRDMHAAARAVSAIMAQPITPCALEFMDGASIDMVRNYSDLDLPEAVGALLMIEVDGPAHGLDQSLQAVIDAARIEGMVGIEVAHSEQEVERLWRARKALSPALRNIAPKKINEDVVVPVSRIPDLIGGLERLSDRFDIRIVNFGHAGNGNIHVNLLSDPDDPAMMARAHECLSETFDLVLQLGGTLSGEHGVGLEKRDYIDREIEPATLRLMHAIRRQFDPLGILNPGKTLPECGVATEETQ
jgi:D-lactate dehydrogenase